MRVSKADFVQILLSILWKPLTFCVGSISAPGDQFSSHKPKSYWELDCNWLVPRDSWTNDNLAYTQFEKLV